MKKLWFPLKPSGSIRQPDADAKPENGIDGGSIFISGEFEKNW